MNECQMHKADSVYYKQLIKYPVYTAGFAVTQYIGKVTVYVCTGTTGYGIRHTGNTVIKKTEYL